MKTIIIGRDESCDVVIIDRTNVASRRHAVINIDNLGRMTITDHSSNGTYINGIRMSENEPVPVTRKDVISFAQVSDLNWSLIPNIKQRNFLILGASLAVVAIAVILLVTLNKKTDSPLPPPTPVTTVTTPPVNKNNPQEKVEPRLQDETPSEGVESETDDVITIIKKKKTEEKTDKKTNKNKDKEKKKEETVKKDETASLEKEKEIEEQDEIDDKEVKTETETKTEAETKTEIKTEAEKEVEIPKEKNNKTLVNPIIF